MNPVEIIRKKRDGGELTYEELNFFIDTLMKGETSQAQMSALMMAIYFVGLTSEETANLTGIMAKSGEILDLSSIPGIKVDKHSTGGVSDSTSLVVGPIVAANGVPFAKMSGRGLGHTGGTVDKLESIRNFRVDLTVEEFVKQVNDIGISIIAQTGSIATADKILYALRDVTGTVESLPLIASSIMSKKLAVGADKILLDVKTGSGAFMKTLEDSIALAKEMVSIGEAHDKETVAIVSDMNRPLGDSVGNSLEVVEAIHVLSGKKKNRLYELSIILAGWTLFLGRVTSSADAGMDLARETIESGTGLEKLCRMVSAQGGEANWIKEPTKFPIASKKSIFRSDRAGIVQGIDAMKIGQASLVLGTGRTHIDDEVDLYAGIEILTTIGERVVPGSPLATLYAENDAFFEEAYPLMRKAIHIEEKVPEQLPLTYAVVDSNGVKYIEGQKR